MCKCFASHQDGFAGYSARKKLKVRSFKINKAERFYRLLERFELPFGNDSGKEVLFPFIIVKRILRKSLFFLKTFIGL